MAKEIVPVRIDDEVTVMVEARVIGGEEDVGIGIWAFDDVTKTVAAIADAMVNSLKEVSPKKASIEFGLEIAIESGKLTTLIVQDSAKANLKITLEW